MKSLMSVAEQASVCRQGLRPSAVLMVSKAVLCVLAVLVHKANGHRFGGAIHWEGEESGFLGK